MSVFTCFNHGTGFNRAKGEQKKELVHVLSQLVRGQEASITNGVLQTGSFLINEGPGSTSGGLSHPSVNNPYLGTKKGTTSNLSGGMAPLEASLVESGLIGGDFLAHFRGETPMHWAMTGNITGAGWTDNTARAVFIIQALKFEHGIDIKTVNMTGWSRGAVTCIRIANLISKVFGNEIECNIFGIDPVAGQNAGLNKEDTQILPSCVKNFFAILSSHERRETFKPQDLSRIRPQSHATRVLFLPMPGTHSQQVCKTEGLREAYDISIRIAYACLRHWGTDFTSPPDSAVANARDMCEHYALMRYKMDQGTYKKKQTSGIVDRIIGIGLRRREFAKKQNMQHYVVGGKTSYWVNEHHRACFQLAYPSLYTTIFAMPPSSGTGWIGGKRRITENLTGSTWLLNSLLAHKFIAGLNNNQIWVANAGSGYYEGTENLHATWPLSIPVA
jgi:hypothetical protein